VARSVVSLLLLLFVSDARQFNVVEGRANENDYAAAANSFDASQDGETTFVRSVFTDDSLMFLN